MGCCPTRLCGRKLFPTFQIPYPAFTRRKRTVIPYYCYTDNRSYWFVKEARFIKFLHFFFFSLKITGTKTWKYIIYLTTMAKHSYGFFNNKPTEIPNANVMFLKKIYRLYADNTKHRYTHVIKQNKKINNS